MKRSPIQRKASLKRSTASLSRTAGLGRGNGQPKRRSSLKAGKPKREPTPPEWKAGVPHGFDPHHVVEQQHIKREGGNVWDLRNRWIIDERTHSRHTQWVDRLRLSDVPLPAVEFAVELFGRERARAYLLRYYACHDPECLPAPLRALLEP